MSSYSHPAGPESLSTPSMTKFYLKDEPQASMALRHMANSLNAAAYESFRSPEHFIPPHIGFDLEWKPNFRPGEAENPIAVIQIAFQTASYVVHVRWMRNLPDGLAEILENPRIVKVGVGIQNDAKKLFRDLRICLNSCVDLSLFVKCVDSGLFAERLDRYAGIPLLSSAFIPPSLPPDSTSPWEFYASETFLGPHFHRLFRGSYLTSIGLARLAETYEGIVLTKGKITRSNWDLELSPVQITYAALDAYAGSVVYTHLIRLFSLLEPTRRPKREFYAFDCIRGTLYNCCGDNRRTLLGEQMEDTELPRGYTILPTFNPVEDEIALHLHGVGSDQPRGLIVWNPSNPEYDPGPMPPQKTSEEKEEARIARQKRRQEKMKEEAAQNGGAKTDSEVVRAPNDSVSVALNVARAPPRIANTGDRAQRRTNFTPKNFDNHAPTNSPGSSALPTNPALPIASSGPNGIHSSMQTMQISKAPGAPTSLAGPKRPAPRRRRFKNRNPSTQQNNQGVRG
ncbi:hypothetical protein F5876DRAFT_75444 [Lentinula aff. lateritia]|uniref:Uncharacterized protein n=1 Tax=Lentinula aff. lateritia TaxID=2804960 RepID=A0ACC1U435_9AGAR|nr:hypothetical protein F5876DRAFT_75444 [Lentinula aff. lateritia]